MYKITASNDRYTFIARVEAEDEVSALQQVLDDTDNFPNDLYGTEDLEVELLTEEPPEPSGLSKILSRISLFIVSMFIGISIASAETVQLMPIDRTLDVICTAYNLSYDSCGKYPGEYGYGITANGTDLSNKSREQAMAIAVDPSVIPLGTYVQLIAEDPDFSQYNGIYQACDTGGAVVGNHIDIYMGEGTQEIENETRRFGRRRFTANVLAFLPDPPIDISIQTPYTYKKEDVWSSTIQFNIDLKNK